MPEIDIKLTSPSHAIYSDHTVFCAEVYLAGVYEGRYTGIGDIGKMVALQEWDTVHRMLLILGFKIDVEETYG